MLTGTRESVKSGMPLQTPSSVSSGSCMVRGPVSAFSVGQESVWQSGEQVVADVLASQSRVAVDELAHCFLFVKHPVDEVADFHIRAVENCHLPRGSDFRIIRRVEVQ